MVVVLLGLAACGTETQGAAPTPGKDGLVDATPRALAAIVIEHVDPGEPRRTTGHWSDWNDPLSLESQVDFGVNPEGSEDGQTRSVRINAVDLSSFGASDRKSLRCRPQDGGRCEEEAVDGGMLIYKWYTGVEEEEAGTYAWTVVRGDEAVQVVYEGSGQFDEDPRGMDLAVEPEDLRAAALDPAMGLRTTVAAWKAGSALKNYEGVESAPGKPTIVPTTPKQLAARVVDYVELKPSRIGPTALTDFGPDAIGVRMEFPAAKLYDAFTLDVLTTVGRVEQIDPLPCPVQRVRTSLDGCFSWDEDTAGTWTLAEGDRPGTMWIIGAQDDDEFNRVESVGVLITSTGINRNPFANDPGLPQWRLPDMLLGALSPMTSDLSLGPERATG